jgi:hypothetical protein
MAGQKRFGFTVPKTRQGENVKKAVDGLFTDLRGTEAWPLFEGLAQRPPLFAGHRRQVAGAVIALANGELGSDDQEWLAAIHHDVDMTPDQFNQVATIFLGKLAAVDEMGIVTVLQEVVPDLREIWVKD